jgi:exopolyphosphatase/pppGpp-phosphohydrolase
MTAFTRRHQLSLHRLQWWRAQLAQPSATASEQVRLLPVVPRQAPLIAIGTAAMSAVSVTVGETRIDISDIRQADPQWLATLVMELRGSGS